MEEEQIQIPTMEDVLTPQPAELTAYGFVSIEALQFQQPLFLVELTNQQLLQGGVVMFQSER